MPIRTHKCPSCGKMQDQFQPMQEDINYHLKCECGFEGDMPVDFGNCRTNVILPRDWTYGKSAEEISRYLAPNEDGSYDSPY